MFVFKHFLFQICIRNHLETRSLDTIMQSSSNAYHIPFEIEDTRRKSKNPLKALVDHEKDIHLPGRTNDISVFELSIELIKVLVQLIRKAGMEVWKLLQLVPWIPIAKRIPWVKVILIGLVAYFFLLKDLNLNWGQRSITTMSHSGLGIEPADALPAKAAVVNIKNPFAPSDLHDLKTKEALTFVRKYMRVAVDEMHKTGIPASIKMAQAMVESNCGKSLLASKNNNFFGIKCFSRRCPKGHCTNAYDDHHKDFFRKYGSVGSSWEDHSRLLQKDRYKPLFELNSADYEAWAHGLKKAGYATDKKYADKLIRTIRKYQLNLLDEQ